MGRDGSGVTKKRIGDDKYIFRWRENGKSVMKTFNCTAEESEQILQEALLRNGRKHTGVYSFDYVCGEYDAWAKRQKSYYRKRYLINDVRQELGNYKMNQITRLILEKYQTRLLNDGMAEATINRKIATIKHIFTKALDWEMITADVREPIRGVKNLRENNHRLRYLTDEEEVRLIDACSKSKQANLVNFVLVAIHTGARRGELRSLTWDQVDLQNGFIFITDKVAKSGHHREIPINNTLRSILIAMKVKSSPGEAKLFPGNAETAWEVARKRAFLIDFHFHDLRHTFATRIAMAGIPLGVLQKLMGHSDISQTMRYAQVQPDRMVDAVMALDKIKERKVASL